MADENKSAYSYQAPDQYIYNLLTGGGNRFGLLPGVEQYYANQFKNLGGADSSPYTYTGDRIADFSPRERLAMQYADQGIGSYKPYFARGTGLAEEGLSTLAGGTSEAKAAQLRAQQQGEDYTRFGLDTLKEGYRRGDALTGESARLLRDTASAQYDPSSYTSYMDPYEDQVVQQTMKDIRESSGQGDIGRRAEEVGQGAFGGARSRITQGESDRATDRNLMESVSGIRSQGYQQAQGQAQGEFARRQAARQGAAAGLGGLGQQRFGMAQGIGEGFGAGGQQLYGMGAGSSAQLSGLAGQLAAGQTGASRDYMGFGNTLTGMQQGDISSLMNTGAMNRARNQAGLDLNYQNFVGQYNMPQQLMSGYANFLTGAGPLAGGTGYSGETRGNPYGGTGGAAGYTGGTAGSFNPYFTGGGYYAEGGVTGPQQDAGLSSLSRQAPEAVRKMGFKPVRRMHGGISSRFPMASRKMGVA